MVSASALYPLRHYSSDDIPPEISCQITSLFSVLMMQDVTGDDRFHDPFAHSERFDHFAVVERGLLISHADVSQHTITHAGETYRVGGIGEVMTHPNFRREGHGGRVVAAATEFIRGSGADVGMLFTNPDLEAFYALYGWSALRPAPGLIFGDHNQSSYDDPFVMMLFLSETAWRHRDDFLRGPIFIGKSLW